MGAAEDISGGLVAAASNDGISFRGAPPAVNMLKVLEFRSTPSDVVFVRPATSANHTSEAHALTLLYVSESWWQCEHYAPWLGERGEMRHVPQRLKVPWVGLHQGPSGQWVHLLCSDPLELVRFECLCWHLPCN